MEVERVVLEEEEPILLGHNRTPEVLVAEDLVD